MGEKEERRGERIGNWDDEEEKDRTEEEEGEIWEAEESIVHNI